MSISDTARRNWGAGAIVLVILYFVAHSRAETSPGSPTTDGYFFRGDSGTVSEPAVVCLTRAAFERAAELSGDRTALASYLGALGNGCAEMPAGTRVVVEERPTDGTGPGKATVQIRRNGSATSVWTFESYLKP